MASWVRVALVCVSRYFFLIVWVLINNIILWTTYYNYKKMPQHFYTRSMIGRGLCVSRGTASVLNLSCALILLPVCRGLNSFIYRVLNRISRSLMTWWLSSLKVIHMTFAFTVVIASVIHSLAHVVNATNFSRYYNTKYEDINWAKYKDQSPALLILTSVAGITGIAMIILLFLMLLLSMKCVRESYYDLFWSSHYLFLPFLVLVIIHPISGVLKEQTNYHIHIPGCYTSPLENNRESEGVGFPEPTYGDPGVCITQPVFSRIKSESWLWVSVPLVIYMFDFVFRLIRRNRCYFTVSSAIQFPGNVTQLTLIARTNHAFSSRPGQYILLQCPRLSSLEWHPFTVTSSLSTSSHTRITVLIRRRGDWTKAVCSTVHTEGSGRILPSSHKHLKLLVDGPFCSPLESMLKYSTVICIAAGIGITPFAALFSYLHNHDYARLSYPQRIHLVWTVRSYEHLTWFSSLISSLHQKFWYLNQPDRLEIRLYVTREFAYDSLRELLGKDSSVLLNRVHKGRPNWTQHFKEWTQFHKRNDTAVFLCGPKSLTKQVRATCTRLNQQGYVYKCIHEAFS